MLALKYATEISTLLYKSYKEVTYFQNKKQREEFRR